MLIKRLITNKLKLAIKLKTKKVIACNRSLLHAIKERRHWLQVTTLQQMLMRPATDLHGDVYCMQ